jgi:hypothetical protein
MVMCVEAPGFVSLLQGWPGWDTHPANLEGTVA